MELFEESGITALLMIISLVVTLTVWSHKSLMVYGFHREYYAKGDYVNFVKQVFLFQFIHGDILHLVMNMYFLYSAGPLLEGALGTTNYLIFFLSTTLVSAYALYFFAPKSNTIGISGFCMALLSFLWIALYTAGSPDASSIGVLLIINIALGFAPGISFVGHAAGAISGLVFWLITRNII